MSEFQVPFDSTSPTGEDYANKIDTFIRQDTKQAIDERIGLEHYPLSNTGGPEETEAPGRHRAGIVGCLFLGTTTDMYALQSPGNGAMAYATDENNFYRYDKSSDTWNILALGAETILADGDTLVIDGNVLSMNRQHQQWTEMEDITYSSDVITDCNLSNSFHVILTGDVNLKNPSGLQKGATYLWVLEQDSNGGHSVTFNETTGTMFAFPGGVQPSLTADPHAKDIITGIFDGDKILCSVMYDVK